MMLSRARELHDYVIALRRDLHRHPELSGKETETRKRLRSELESHGISCREIGATSLVGTINEGKGGRIVMLRADIDALPIKEQSGEEFTSVNEGVMHACGHDAHSAMLMGAARILLAMKDELPGEVRLVFQEAEETLSGARRLVADGVLEGVGAAFGMHGMSMLDTGTYDLTAGYRMAGCDTVYVTFEGESGHVGAPHLARDSIYPACVFTANLNSVVAKDIDPLQPVVIGVGRFHGGTKANIVAKITELDISVRYFDPAVRKIVQDAIVRHAKSIADSFGIKSSVRIEESALSMRNDPDMTALADLAARKVFGPGKNLEQKPLTGSEDMSYYLEKVPGTYAMLGFRNEALGSIYFPHSDKFKLDEDYLAYGTALFAQVAVDFLNDMAVRAQD